MFVVNKLQFAALVFLGTMTLRADVFSFSYSGTFLGKTVTAAGTITATQAVGGIYNITDLTGTRNGVSISDPSSGKGTLIFSGPLSTGTFKFLLNGLASQSDTLVFAAGVYTESGYTGTKVGKNFSISRVPEATTLSIFVMMGLTGWALTRKLRSGKSPRG